MIISLIAAIDEAGGIGSNNQLLAYLPADLKYFKSVTLGKPIIMGRKTYESIGRPLPERDNIVISTRLDATKGITIVPSLNQAIELLKDVPEIMIIGGAQLYAEAINYAKRLYITHIDHQFEADTFFPPIDLAQWTCTQKMPGPQDAKNPFAITFCIYERYLY